MAFDPNIFLEGARLSNQNSRDLTASLTGAIQSYQQRKDLQNAQARKDKEKLAAQAMDIGFIQQQVAMGAELTPQQKAKLDVYLSDKSAAVAANPETGSLYRKYQPTGVLGQMMGAQGDVPQEIGGTYNTLQQAGAGQLLPPPTQQDMGDMPTPIGEEGVTVSDLTKGMALTPKLSRVANEKLMDVRAEEMAGERKERKAMAKEARTFVKSLPSQIKQIDSLMGTIDRAIGQTNWSNTGGIIRGKLVPATNLDANLLKVKANEFIDQIIQAKDRGATFGSLDRNEGEKLESLRGSLNRAQPQEQLDATLNELKSFHQDYRQRLIGDAEDAAAQGFIDPKQVEMIKKSLAPTGITQSPKAQEIKAQYQAGKITKEQARGMLKTLGGQ